MLSYLKRAVTSFLYEDTTEVDEDVYPIGVIKNDPWKIPSRASLENTVFRRGTISFIGETYGVIDQVHAFPSELLQGNNLSVGAEVEYRFLPASGNGTGNVISVTEAVPEDAWDDASDNINTVETVVKERTGRELVFATGATCNLDNVTTSFLPVVGDKVILEMTEDASGEKIVKAIVASQTRVRSGFVTRFMACQGEINNEIRFNLDACVAGFQPLVADEVVAEIIASNQGTCNWRAISVSHIGRTETVPEVLNEEISGSHNAITITGTRDFGAVKLQDFSQELELEIANIGSTFQKLIGGNFKRRFAQIEASNLNPTQIAPSSSIKVLFRAKPTYVGRHTELFTFNFQGFDIVRSFGLMVSESLEISDRVKSVPYSKRVVTFEDIDVEGETRTYGAKPWAVGRFNKLPIYKLPEKLWKMVTSDPDSHYRSSPEVKKKLLEANPCLAQKFIPTNYLERLRLLVYFEEISLKMSLWNLALDNVFFLQRGPYLVLEIPNLAEKRPSVIKGDKVIVSQPWNSKFETKSSHLGYIYEVTLNSVSVIFHPSFQDTYDGTMCNVRFDSSFVQFSHQHNAIVRAGTNLGPAVLFPEGLPQRASPHPLDDLTVKDVEWCNKDLNSEQKFAVVNVLRGESRPLPYFIFGPPGTGKTVTVVEAVLQICRLTPGCRILVCGPSNSSADLLAQRIIQGGHFRPNQCARLCAFSRSEDSIPEDLEEYCILAEENEDQGGGIALGYHRITVGTCSVVSRLHLMKLPRGHFTHIIIDEAGYASEPETLIPLTFLDKRSGQAVLAGDPQQLGPVFMSPYAKEFKLDESLLARLMKRFPYARDPDSYPDTLGYDPRLITQLTVNYRSVPEILKLPSDLFYHSVLQATVSPKVGREAQVIRAFAEVVSTDRDEPVTILFHGVRGENCREGDSPSWMNPHELCEALRYIRLLYTIGVKSEEIGVISPYRKQVTKLRQLVTEFQIPVPKTGSVEEFQGQERMVIIMSCVRSTASHLSTDQKMQLGFVKSPQRVNVALTRARALLIILGNPHLLYIDPCWRAVISYCVERNAYVGCDLPEGLISKSAQLPSEE